LDLVAAQPVDLLGHSMGGIVSLTAVVGRPDLVHSLVLMDTSAWSFLPTDPGIRKLVHDYMSKFDPARGVPSRLGFGGPEDALIEAATPPEWQAARDALYGAMDPCAIKGLGCELMADGVGSLRDSLPNVTGPVTVLVGEHDHPLVDQAPELVAALPSGRLSVIPGAYHSPQLTHADQWLDAVRAHLEVAHA
jgi:pimeloyl-ACP methyl ester carboxylesterase